MLSIANTHITSEAIEAYGNNQHRSAFTKEDIHLAEQPFQHAAFKAAFILAASTISSIASITLMIYKVAVMRSYGRWHATLLWANLFLLASAFLLFAAVALYVMLTYSYMNGGYFEDGIWLTAYGCLVGLICCGASNVAERTDVLPYYYQHLGDVTANNSQPPLVIQQQHQQQPLSGIQLISACRINDQDHAGRDDSSTCLLSSTTAGPSTGPGAGLGAGAAASTTAVPTADTGTRGTHTLQRYDAAGNGQGAVAGSGAVVANERMESRSGYGSTDY